MNNKSKYALIFSALIILTAAVLLLNFFLGSAEMSFSDTLGALFGKGGETAVGIMWKIRIPRALSSLILGGALALSGYLLQTFFQNPIAGPFVLGVSSGSKLAVALAMVAAAGTYGSLTSLSLIAAAFVGALISLALVLLVSKKVANMAMLIVCGVMIGYICSAVTEFVVAFADDSDIVNLHNWSMGTFSGMNMDNVKVMLIVTALGLIGSLLISKPIAAYSLGEAYAKNLGVNITALRATLILLSGLLAACVTAFAGPVSFVGIAVPHIIRTLMRTSKPLVLIPACFLGGSIFFLAPTELSISAVTAVFGAPVVIWMMIHRRRGEGI